MAGHYRAGFTIIEVMLFLAITGALAVGVLVSAGASIASQRYKDAVATLQSDVQQQYEDAVSVVNDRAVTIDDCSEDRGRSDCLLLGKLMTVTSGGKVSQYRVYGDKPSRSMASSAAYRDEYEVLRSYNPRVVDTNVQESDMEWGTGIARPARGERSGSAPLDIGILVLRSPQSGLVYTFTREDATVTDLSSIIGVDFANIRRTICVAPSGWTIAETLALTLSPNAASANAVEIRSNNMMAGEGTEC